MDSDQDTRRPNLHKLLEERLPALGLDAEMYGPYVWGDDEDSDGDDKDDDELREVVVGVLQASSETHAEDDAVWEELIQGIQAANLQDSQLRKEQREKHLQETKTKMEEDLARAKKEEAEKQPTEEKKKSSQVDDEQKRILMQRYGYDEPAEDEGDGSGFGANSSSASKKPAASGGSGVVSNKDAAKAAYLEKSRELRGAQKTTKAEERKKTKEQKANKAQLKEARRKRATKGERRA